MQVSDAKRVAMPANWPNNELIDDRVIIPLPTSEKDVEERLERSRKGEIECYDWWLCYRKL